MFALTAEKFGFKRAISLESELADTRQETTRRGLYATSREEN